MVVILFASGIFLIYESSQKGNGYELAVGFEVVIVSYLMLKDKVEEVLAIAKTK